MKKNKMMRAASALLVATLLSTSIISGTFAKYTTTAEGSDSARVAKWGIQMEKGADMFSATYDSSKETKTVSSSGGEEKVVAPGTSGSTTYKVTGAPETAYEITFKGVKNNDVFLAQGLQYTYTDSDTAKNTKYTVPTGTSAGTVDSAYYPVNYSVKITSTSTSCTFGKVNDSSNDKYITTSGQEQTFETLAEAMEALSNTKITYSSPNTEAGLEVIISWEWQFDSNASKTINVTSGHIANDAYDTVLGDIAAKNQDLKVGTGSDLKPVSDSTDETTANSDYDTNIGYSLTMTATQID